jgi:hypothetical protein
MIWEEVVAHIQGSQPVTEAGPGWFTATWSGAGTRAIGPQPLRVIHAGFADQRCVIILTLIGSELALSPEEALLLSGTMSFGALMLRDHRYLFRVSALLSSLSVPELETLLAYTAATGGVLRRQFARTTTSTDLFAWALD